MPDNVKPKVLSAKDLDVYKVTYKIAMEIFEISRIWPKEEKYSLTDQIRRSSRSVCVNLREAWLPAPLPAPHSDRMTEPTGRKVGHTGRLPARRAYSAERG